MRFLGDRLGRGTMQLKAAAQIDFQYTGQVRGEREKELQREREREGGGLEKHSKAFKD